MKRTMLRKRRLAALGAATMLILPATYVVASVEPLGFASGVPTRENPFDAVLVAGPIEALRDALTALAAGRVGDSPVVPTGTKPFVPSPICHST